MYIENIHSKFRSSCELRENGKFPMFFETESIIKIQEHHAIEHSVKNRQAYVNLDNKTLGHKVQGIEIFFLSFKIYYFRPFLIFRFYLSIIGR